MMDETAQAKVFKCSHHKFIPLLMIAFALVFLLGAYDVVTPRFISIAWPVIVGLAGVMKLTEGKCKCC